MKRTNVLARARRVFQVAGLSDDEVERQVANLERMLAPAPDGGDEVVVVSNGGAPLSVAEGHNALDYALAEVLAAVPVHAFRNSQAAALRFAALPKHAAQHLPGYPVTPTAEATLEERLGMIDPAAPPAARTLEEKLGMQRPPTRELDELQRRGGDYGV